MDVEESPPHQVLEWNAEGIEEHLKKIESQLDTSLGKYILQRAMKAGLSVHHPDFEVKAWELRESLARQQVPPALRKKKLKEARERLPDLLYYSALVSSLLSDIRRGLRGAQSAWRLAPNPKEGALTVALHGKRTETEDLLALKASEASTQLVEALSDILEGLRLALGLLADMDPEHFLRGAISYRHLKTQGEKVHRRAGVELFRLIMESDDDRSLERIWQLAGTSYHPEVELDGVSFVFKKGGQKLHIFRVDADGEPQLIASQRYAPATLYEWRQEALKEIGEHA